MTLVDPYVVCEKNSYEMTPVVDSIKNTHAMTLVDCEKSTHAMTLVDPYVVCEKNTHAMTLVIVSKKNTHAMTLVDPCVVSIENTHFNDSGCC